MGREKVWWTVRTDCGTRSTLAVSRTKAIRNVRYRLVMDDRGYDRPKPSDLAYMRDIEVLEVTRDGARESGHGARESGQGNPYEGMRK